VSLSSQDTYIRSRIGVPHSRRSIQLAVTTYLPSGLNATPATRAPVLEFSTALSCDAIKADFKASTGLTRSPGIDCLDCQQQTQFRDRRPIEPGISCQFTRRAVIWPATL